IDAVVHTLFEALVLVVLVVVLFLQTWRASVIPLAAVPVSLVGTLAIMHLLGFSLNALSLFGLVLAIGIVVDDAIVVVENVERNIAKGLAPIAAAQQAMREVTSPIIATALVPGGFIPQQDKQYLVAYAQLPEAATLDRTEAVIHQMDAIMLAEPGVAHTVSFPGLSINGFVNSPNSGIAFAGLADFSKDGTHVKTVRRSAS